MTDTVVAGIIGAVAAIAGGVGGGILSGWYQDRRDERDRPRLKLDFDPQADSVETGWPGPHAFEGVILRASLHNEGVTSALNCRVFLTALTGVQNSANTSTAFKESRQTPWAGWHFEPRAVPREVTFYVDFVRVSKQASGWQFIFERESIQDEPLKGYQGTYRFRLVAVADNAEPAYLDIDVDYRGNWKEFRAWKPSK